MLDVDAGHVQDGTIALEGAEKNPRTEPLNPTGLVLVEGNHVINFSPIRGACVLRATSKASLGSL